jgi:type VI secretion system protein ImpA
MVTLETLLLETKEAPPCGPNLEHDLSFFELEEAGRTKPEQRIGDAVKPAEEPNWPKVVDVAQGLLSRTKDLRVAALLTRALTRTEGIPGLATGLGLIHGLLERYWDQVHPLLEADQGDDAERQRLSALASLTDPETVIDPETVRRDLRDTNLVNSREHGQLQVREVEIALGRLAPPRSGSSSPSKGLAEIHRHIASAFGSDRTIPTSLHEAHDRLLAIQTIIADRLGADRGIDVKPLMQTIDCLVETCDTALGVRTTPTGTSASGNGQVPDAMGSAIAGEIRTREDAERMLDLVCSYLEHHEPSNPAPLFIRRAQRLMTKNFVEIVKDLMPDSLTNLEKLAGEAVDKRK